MLFFFTALRIPEIQELLGHAVNNIVKHYYKPEKEVREIPYIQGSLKAMYINRYTYI